jgi:hypothetical protein
MSDEEQLGRRLRAASANPPAGRDLLRGVHRASARRKARLAAVGSGLGVATVVAGGAGLAGIFSDGRTTAAGGVGTATASAAPALSPSASTPAATALSPAVAPPASAPAVSAPSALPSAGAAPTTPAVAAEYWYQRTINEQYGIRSVRRAWVGSDGSLKFQQPFPGKSTAETVKDKWVFRTDSGASLSWSDFGTVPSAAQLHAWLYETPAASVKDFGHDLTGTPRANEYAFESGLQLLVETPATSAFRLAVIEAVKQVPGVTVAESVKDEVGRTGTQLSLHAAPDVGVATSTTSDIVDPVDGRLLQGEITDDSACPAGSLIWRAVYLESGSVANDTTVLPETIAAPTGQPANCSLPGAGVPPGASVTSRPAAR